MGFVSRTTTIGKDRINLFVCVLILMGVAVDFAGTAATKRAVNCRKYVHAPECRGIAAKRDLRDREDYRLPPEERDMPEIDKQGIPDNLANNRAFFSDLFRKMLQRNLELDTGTNYLK